MKMQCVVLPNVAIFWFQSAVHRECVHECLFRDGIALYAELTGLKLDGLPKQHSGSAPMSAVARQPLTNVYTES